MRMGAAGLKLPARDGVLSVDVTRSGAPHPPPAERRPATDLRTRQKRRHNDTETFARRRWLRKSLSTWIVCLATISTSLVLVILAVDLYSIATVENYAEAKGTVRKLMRSYIGLLRAHPLPVRVITAGFIFSVADLCAQVSRAPSFSVQRLLRFGLFGGAFIGPFLHLWYALTLRYGPADSVSGSTYKAIFEQCTLEPACITAFILFDSLGREHRAKSVRKRMYHDFVRLWRCNALFWIPCNFVNYYLGAPELRVVFANVCSFFWNVYFSSLVNKPPPSLPVR